MDEAERKGEKPVNQAAQKFELDTTDLDRHMGKPIEQARMIEPLHNNDIRRWVQSVHYPNRIHYDSEYAAQSRWTRLVAPQSFAIICDDGNGAGPASVGRIPESHLLFGGDEWWFFGPRIFGGDHVVVDRIPFDYVVKETKFAGPTCFQRGDNHYLNDRGERIATQRATTLRYSAAAGRAMAEKAIAAASEEPQWTDEQIEALEDRKFQWIKMLHDLGHGKRYWDDVNVGDKLPERVIGPHSLVTLTTEYRAQIQNTWGAMRRRTDLDILALGYVKEMAGKEMDGEMEKVNPELTDGAYIGPSRGHLSNRWARFIGMPRAYGYGISIGAWIIDYFAGWAGEWGMVLHVNSLYRSPSLTGDISIMNGTILGKEIDKQGRKLVRVDCAITNQLGATIATATGEAELPGR
ncbi:MAG: hypothetical protein EPO08_16410 [Rhodospirillaceae bacterium]|nr:MAG: hypothetical protein EPO08_16410 [Rhodospirillaceae bacterium]